VWEVRRIVSPPRHAERAGPSPEPPLLPPDGKEPPGVESQVCVYDVANLRGPSGLGLILEEKRCNLVLKPIRRGCLVGVRELDRRPNEGRDELRCPIKGAHFPLRECKRSKRSPRAQHFHPGPRLRAVDASRRPLRPMLGQAEPVSARPPRPFEPTRHTSPRGESSEPASTCLSNSPTPVRVAQAPWPAPAPGRHSEGPGAPGSAGSRRAR